MLHAASPHPPPPPPRRAKRPRSPARQPRLILPKQVLEPSSPPKRGRKPAPLSRSAREAQRRLNHSIIEKARRTKINNALATLKALVPLDYGRKAKSQDNSNSNNSDDNADPSHVKNHDDDNDGNDDDDDDDDTNDDNDDDGEYSVDKKKPKPKSGKKEEKEREYKLEILVRTVAFMQDLLQRVAVLEQANSLCSNCSEILHVAAPHDSTLESEPAPVPELVPVPEPEPEPEPSPPPKRARTERYDPNPTHRIPSPHECSPPDHPSTQNRLPPISSWLPDTLDPPLFSSSHTRNNGDWVPSLQLPTPPSSTQVRPAVTSTRRRVSSSSPLLIRTPEEEHAATMLLQISGGGASSPPFRPLPPSIMSPPEHILSLTTTTTSTSSSSSSSFRMHLRKTMEGRYDSSSMAVQTPSSLLGLITLRDQGSNI